MKVPRWLVLQAEIDYLLYCLENMYRQEKRLSGIERMIDESTGFNKQKLKEATRLHNRIKKLQKEFEELPKT